MKEVKLRNIVLGNGRPKIAVPIVADDQISIEKQAQAIVNAQPDVVEWRIDFFDDVLDFEKLRSVALKLRKILAELPLLTTFRTIEEGGSRKLDEAKYFQIVHFVIENELTDAIDLELFHQRSQIERIVALANTHGIKVIMSSHDFARTPAAEEIYYRLHVMADLGADVAKIAVMPQNSNDVLTLLQATAQAHAQLDLPLITMAMGDLGKVTRMAGEVFGSALTFGAVEKASAPGQLSIAELRRALDNLKI